MIGQRPKTGIFVTVAGVEYAANSYPQDGKVTLYSRSTENPSPELFGWHDALRVWLATIPTDHCDSVAEVTTYAEHKGHECQVIDIGADGSVGLFYVGEEKSKAARDGFVQTDAGNWAKTVNIYEISNYIERYKDLLFAGWAAKATAGGAG
ncbi:hypothetical protein SAMN05421504_11560 [Amycolatopsis xylanica]|uniref:Uncharacterized protein n=1 Tax=Amycolatopsis xylanica TaxID=589385 RepID=A0A1H3SSD5_9PSEU|nr:hypothetical protein [Amycolatopsis xylanica]SDZ40640.1 hypothetical protein SAMN05421504_11560 [Amycolatopsis xylanica]